MNQELQKQLYEKYPKIFRQKDLPMKETCLCWGLEIGDGWFDLIDKLCSYLQWYTDKNDYPQVEATQVKEKYGSLRFYYVIIPSKKDERYLQRKCGFMEGLILFAEDLSNSICENCGTNQNVNQTEGWIVTLCDKCKEERNKK